MNRIVSDDGNGGTRVAYNVTGTWSRLQTVLGVLIAAGTIVGAVFLAARTGVQIEVTDAIKVEAQQENGIIHREIHGCVEEMIEEVQGVFQDDLDIFEKEQRTTAEAVIRLEVRQIGVIEKVDQQHEEVMTELRALRDND